jgi:hypothetical protein
MFFQVVQSFLRCFWTLRLPIADFSVQATSNALLQPEVLVGHAHEKFDADGRLVHEATRDFLATFLQRFTELIALHAMAGSRHNCGPLAGRRR